MHSNRLRPNSEKRGFMVRTAQLADDVLNLSQGSSTSRLLDSSGDCCSWSWSYASVQGRRSLYPGGADAPQQKLGEGFLVHGGEL